MDSPAKQLLACINHYEKGRGLMSEVISPIVFQLGAGGIFGFLVGYTIKKLLKLAALILGIFALILMYLEYSGLINVNYERLSQIVQGFLSSSGNVSHLLVTFVSHLPFAGSFTVGAVLGLKKG